MSDVLKSDDAGGLLERIDRSRPSLSRSDKKIADFLLRAPDEFIRASVRSVASSIGISEPTVVRFCRNVGYEGFKDLKFQLTQELALRQALTDAGRGIAAGETLRADGGVDAADLGAHLYQSAVAALNRAKTALDVVKLVDASCSISAAKRVIIYGIGGSSAILANEMHNRLFRLGVSAMVFADSYAQQMAAATLGKGDIALFISSTGRPHTLLDSLELAKYYGASCIGITDANSVLGRQLDICLHVDLSQSGVDELQPNPMRYGQLFIIDALAFQVARDLGEKARLSLRKTRASLAALHGVAPQQPIGD